MTTLETTICLGIGDNIIVRMYLDPVKHNFSSIKISHDKKVMQQFRSDPGYTHFSKQLGELLFSEPPYQFVETQFPIVYTYQMLKKYAKNIVKPNLNYLLCRGAKLDINEPYITISTKIRNLYKKDLFPLLPQLWKVLSQKQYKIVIMGEREMEYGKEYIIGRDHIYTIYEQIITNLPNDKIIDLTVPALGVTAPTLSKVQQDCLIIEDAKFNIVFGIGGNVWMSSAVSDNTIGFRYDDDINTDLLSQSNFAYLHLTKDWQEFLTKIREG